MSTSAVIEVEQEEAGAGTRKIKGEYRHPFSPQARRHAVEAELRLCAGWSDRHLAEELGISRDLVAKIRKALVEAGLIPRAVSRVGSDGKTYTKAGLPRSPDERPPKASVAGERVGPGIETLLATLTKQILEVIAWTQAEGFEGAYKTAGANARGLFQTSAIKLASRADRLRRL